MSDEFGIEATKKVAEALIDTLDLVGKARVDGIGAEDLGLIISLPTVFTKFKETGQVPKEITDMDDQEANEFEAHVKAYAASKRGDVENEKLEEIAADVLLMVPPAVRLINNF